LIDLPLPLACPPSLSLPLRDLRSVRLNDVLLKCSRACVCDFVYRVSGWRMMLLLMGAHDGGGGRFRHNTTNKHATYLPLYIPSLISSTIFILSLPPASVFPYRYPPSFSTTLFQVYTGVSRPSFANAETALLPRFGFSGRFGHHLTCHHGRQLYTTARGLNHTPYASGHRPTRLRSRRSLRSHSPKQVP
jgi:hypothetical protein